MNNKEIPFILDITNQIQKDNWYIGIVCINYEGTSFKSNKALVIFLFEIPHFTIFF